MIISQVFMTMSVANGMGEHQGSIDPAQIPAALKWSWLAQILQLISNSVCKVAVITYLATIHGPSRARTKLAFLWILGILQITSVIVLTALILAQCSPVRKLWDERIPGACSHRLWNQDFAFYQGSEYYLRRARINICYLSIKGLSAFTDVCLVAYPLVLFWSLRLKFAKKVLLCVIFGFGLM